MQRPVSDRTIDTAPLQRVIDMFVAMSAAILEGVLDGPALSKLKTCTFEIERASKELRRTALSNMKTGALARLRSDRAYRAQVRLELGGFHVISRWREKLRASNFPRQIELRAARVDALKQLKTNPDIGCPSDNGAADFERKAARPPREKKPVKTCGAGLFRLAPVPMWLESSMVLPRVSAAAHMGGQGHGQGQGGGKARSSNARAFAPIPLMPEDLEDVEDFEYFEPDEDTAEEVLDPFSNSQRITLEEQKYWEWNEDCQDYFPPPETNYAPEPDFGPDPPPRAAAGPHFVRRI